MSLLPEIREPDAPPEVAATYAALRQATGVPLVNLIWRHLATMPGVLPWAWEAVRPPLQDGSLAAARERLAAALPLPALPAVDAAAWREAGLPAEARGPVLGLVEAYNRGNLTNVILLTALRRRLEGAAPAPSAPPPPAAAPAPAPPIGAIPPLPALPALPAETQALVRSLAARHGGDEGVIPSLYLHLAHWPALLAALPRWLGRLLDPATLGAARAEAVRLATAEADALRPRLAPGAGVPGGHGPAVLAAIGRFTGQVIPEMVPVGLALRRVLGAPGG